MRSQLNGMTVIFHAQGHVKQPNLSLELYTFPSHLTEGRENNWMLLELNPGPFARQRPIHHGPLVYNNYSINKCFTPLLLKLAGIFDGKHFEINEFHHSHFYSIEKRIRFKWPH